MRAGIDQLFNSTITGAALAAAFRLGLLDELEDGEPVSLRSFCSEHDLHHESLCTLSAALHHAAIVEFRGADDTLRRGPAFAEAFANKGYFYWLIAGYGSMLEKLAELVHNKPLTPGFRSRSPREIAFAGRDYGAHFVDPYFAEILNEQPFAAAADIGCGTAERLIALATARPEFHGLGVEIDDAVVDMARNAVTAAGLDGRVKVFEADLKEMTATADTREVDLLFSFFMGHDLWPRAECVQALARLREVFPNARRFLLCDTYRSDALLAEKPPIFTLGFELTHAIMRQFVPSASEWLEVFEESGWECVGQREIGIPYSCFFDLRP